MSLVDAPVGPEGEPAPLPRAAVPVRSGPRGAASPGSHAAADLVPLATLLENCPLFDPADETLGTFGEQMVPRSTRLGIRVRINTGMNKIVLRCGPMDIDATEDVIHRRWGPGRYYIELVPLGGAENGGASGNPFKSRKLDIAPSESDPECDVGIEELPIEWSDSNRVTADMRGEKERRAKIRASGRLVPWDPDAPTGYDPNDPGGDPGYDPNDPGAFAGAPQHGPHGFPQGMPTQHGGFPGAFGPQPGFPGAMPQGMPTQHGGFPGAFGPQPGFPGAPPLNPYAFPPGTPFVLGANGQWVPQPAAAPAAPPPLTAEGIAAAVAAALPKREPSLLEQALASAVGLAVVALKADPLGTMQKVGDLLRPAAPPPVPVPPTAQEIASALAPVLRPAEDHGATMRLELEKVELKNQLAIEQQAAKSALQIKTLEMQNQIEVFRAQANAATAANSQHAGAMNAAVAEMKNQYDALKAQIASGQGDENALMGQFVAIANSPAVNTLLEMGKAYVTQQAQAPQQFAPAPYPQAPQFAPPQAPMAAMPPYDPNAQPMAAPASVETNP